MVVDIAVYMGIFVKDCWWYFEGGKKYFIKVF